MNVTGTLSIPYSIKKKLVDDRESIQNEGMFVPLPRVVTVFDIIEQFKAGTTETKAQMFGMTKQQMAESAEGIKEVFDATLGRVLLYKPERIQYAKILESRHGAARMPSNIFGAEHLARLIVKLPQFLADTPEITDTSVINNTLATATALLHFIDENRLWATQYVQEMKEDDTS